MRNHFVLGGQTATMEPLMRGHRQPVDGCHAGRGEVLIRRRSAQGRGAMAEPKARALTLVNRSAKHGIGYFSNVTVRLRSMIFHNHSQSLGFYQNPRFPPELSPSVILTLFTNYWSALALSSKPSIPRRASPPNRDIVNDFEPTHLPRNIQRRRFLGCVPHVLTNICGCWRDVLLG
jgi:hypothetical protein